jgi:hypothetical protein
VKERGVIVFLVTSGAEKKMPYFGQMVFRTIEPQILDVSLLRRTLLGNNAGRVVHAELISARAWP